MHALVAHRSGHYLLEPSGAGRLAGPLVRNLDTKYLSVRPASKVVLNTVIECLKGEWRVGQRKGSGPPSCSAMNKCKAIHRICDSESAEIR